MKQKTFASLSYESKKKRTRRERFLDEVDAAIPWQRLLALIEPHYPRADKRKGRPAMSLELMVRTDFLQHWFNLSDPAAEDGLYDSESMHRFAGIELGEDPDPDETTIRRFRHLLEHHGLPEQLFNEFRALLEERQLLLKAGTTVVATPGLGPVLDQERRAGA